MGNFEHLYCLAVLLIDARLAAISLVVVSKKVCGSAAIRSSIPTLAFDVQCLSIASPSSPLGLCWTTSAFGDLPSCADCDPEAV